MSVIQSHLQLRCCLCCGRFLCEERDDGRSAGGLGLQVTEANVQQGEMERLTCVHHFMKEFHSH